MADRFTVTLTPSELDVVRYIAQRRHEANAAADVRDRRYDAGRDPLAIGIEGLAAEVAFCKIANVCPDLSFEPRGGGFDCRLADGSTVDVKSYVGDLRRPSLLVPRHKVEKTVADVFPLMFGGPEGPIRFAGWADAVLVFCTPLADMGHGPTYRVAFGDLLDPADLFSGAGLYDSAP